MIPSKTWEAMSAEIQRDLDNGVPWRQIHQLNVAINMADEKAYEYYADRLAEKLFTEEDLEKGPTIIEVGAGYGAMTKRWPAGSTVYHVDLPPMLEIQRRFLSENPREDIDVHFVPVDDEGGLGDLLDVLDGAYLFSVWALTETTREMWDFWVQNAGKLRGAYVLGYERWIDDGERWPWDQLAEQFDEFELEPDAHFPPCDALELIGRNSLRG